MMAPEPELTAIYLQQIEHMEAHILDLANDLERLRQAGMEILRVYDGRYTIFDPLTDMDDAVKALREAMRSGRSESA